MTPSDSISLSTRLRRRSAFSGLSTRRIGHGAFGQAGQQSRLGQGQILGVLAEIKLRCGLEAVHSAAQIDLVAVEGEDLLLGEGALDLDGEICLLNFAGGGALGREKQVARQLHGERGCALRAAVAADVVPGGAGDAEDIDAPVRLEVLVFNGDDGLAQHRRKIVVVDHHAALKREGADDAALAVVEIGGGGGAVALEVVNLGQIDGINQREPGERAGNDGQNDQRGKRVACRPACGGDAQAPVLSGARWAPAKTAGFWRLNGGGSQAIQASSAFLVRAVEKCFRLKASTGVSLKTVPDCSRAPSCASARRREKSPAPAH